LASSARKLPSGSPRSTSPPAVTVEPPPPPTRYGVLCCQAILLVLASIAVKVPLMVEPIGAACPPPVYRSPVVKLAAVACERAGASPYPARRNSRYPDYTALATN
jgi:hypothetical protein